jgi:quinoprotein glucose dehydrogenase
VDLDRHLLVANASRIAMVVKLIPRAQADRFGVGAIGHGLNGGLEGIQPQMGTPYAAELGMFMSPLNVPCQSPPFGTISGIDLVSRKLVWTRRLGLAENSGPLGIPSHLPIIMGVPNMGGSIVTRGGVTFIAAAMDSRFRAFETATGKLLWQTKLPTSGQSTPTTYLANGRQFVVGAVGTGPIEGDYVIAFALPRSAPPVEK